MDVVYPLISSSVAGPLGLKHLPRTWFKCLLFALGRLPEGYRHGNGGFDEFLCTTIGLDPAAMVAFINAEKPNYLRFETWVRENATNINDEARAALDNRVTNQNLPAEMAAPRRAQLGLDDSVVKAIPLNDLDDWAGAHAALVAAAGTASARD